MRLPGLGGNEHAILHGLVGTVNTPSKFHLIPYMLVARDTPSLDEASSNQDLDSMTDRKHPTIEVRKLLDQCNESGVVPEVFRRSPTEHQHSCVIFSYRSAERHIRFNAVALSLNIGIPARLKVMGHKVQSTLTRRPHGNLITSLP
jgi:hypothetical protein|tara:strand:+ start:618 stop:1055 length:438 start_codon:yes stop_codon:yes gene_type:complete